MASFPRNPVLEDMSAIRDPANAPLVDFIRKSANTIYRTELVVAVLGLIVAACAWLLSLILIDHWIWPLSELARFGAWLTFIGGASWWIGVRIIPLLGRRINPEFAAMQIEQAVPEMKEGLISWLQLASQPTTSSRAVLNAVGRLAFRHLREQDANQIVDQYVPIKLMATLVGLIFMGAVYLAVSPKSGAATVQRILMPWAKIAPATRVQILELTPGNVTVTEGANLRVTIQVRGWHKSDSAFIRYSTDDGQSTNQLVPMKADIEGLTYLCDLGASFGGIVQPISYYVEAGDAKAGPFAIQVQAVPLVLVDAVEYRYPKYMQLKSRTVEADGRIEGPEGTQVVLYGHTNQLPMRGRVEFDFKPSKDASFQISKALDLTIDQYSVSSKWFLELNEARSNPTNHSYRLRFENKQSEFNSNPIVYPIRVIPDLPPEIDFSDELKDEFELPINQTIELKLRAQDPDFGLSRISITANLLGRNSATKELFSDPKGVLGNVVRAYVLNPTALNLLPGQKIEINGIAEDNRHTGQDEHPAPNIRQTRTIRIILVEARKDQHNTGINPKSDQVSKAPLNNDNSQGSSKEAKPSQPSKSNVNNSSNSAPNESTEKSAAENDPKNQSSSDKTPESPANKGDQSPPNTDPNGNEPNPNSSMPNASSDSNSTGEKEGEQQKGNNSDQDQKNAAGGVGESANQRGSSSEGREMGSQGASTSDQGQNGSSESTSGGGQSASSQESQSDSSTTSSSNQQPQNGKPSFGNSPQGSDNGRNPTSDSIDEGETFDKLKEWLDQKQPDAVNPSKGQEESKQNGIGNRSPATPDSQTNGQENKSESPSGSNQSNKQPGKNSPDKGPKESSTDATQPENNQPQNGESASPSENRSGDNNGDNKHQSKPANGNEPASQQRPQSSDNNGSTKEDWEGNDRNKSATGTSEKGGSSSRKDSGSENGKSETKNDGSMKDGLPPDDQGKKQGSRSSDGTQGKNQSDNKSDSKSGSSSDTAQNSSKAEGANPENQSNSDDPSGVKSSSSNAIDSSKGEARGATQDPGSENPGNEPNGNQSGNPKQSGDKGSKKGISDTSKPSSSEKSKTDPKSIEVGSNNNQSKENSPSNNSSSGKSPGAAKAGNQSGIARTGNETEESLRNGIAEKVASQEKIEAEAEYARQATDMILKALDRQRNQPDPDLLKRMGWTKEQLQAFVDRWKNARDESLKNPSKQRDYDDALRSLGIVPSGPQNRTASERNDGLRGMSEEGTRIRPPESLREKFEAFQKASKKNPY